MRRAVPLLIVIALAFVGGYWSGKRSLPADKPPLKATEIFPVRDLNVNTWIPEIVGYVHIPDSLPLERKMALLSDELSGHFAHRLIRLKGIDQRNDKNIAVIELVDPDTTYATSWGGTAFQGSTGGAMTTYFLRETFLQDEFVGEWIDGVEFWYRGEPITREWDHISLSGVFWRDTSMYRGD